MTEGHKHRMVDIPSWDRWSIRLLRKPMIHRTNIIAVDKSPYPYRPCEGERGCPNRLLVPKPECWVLTPLSVLHRWTGLVLRTK